MNGPICLQTEAVRMRTGAESRKLTFGEKVSLYICTLYLVVHNSISRKCEPTHLIPGSVDICANVYRNLKNEPDQKICSRQDPLSVKGSATLIEACEDQAGFMCISALKISRQSIGANRPILTGKFLEMGTARSWANSPFNIQLPPIDRVPSGSHMAPSGLPRRANG